MNEIGRKLRLLTTGEAERMTTEQLRRGFDRLRYRIRDRDFIATASRFLKDAGARPTEANMITLIQTARGIIAGELLSRGENY